MEQKGLLGEIIIPPDKSISHRAIIFASLVSSKLKTKIEIKNLSLGEDCLNTLEIFKQLGIKIEFLSKRDLILDGSQGLKTGSFVFDCGNSGTTTRLLMGLFSRCNFNSKLIGDNSLSKRPMKRVVEPLEKMGAKIKSNDFKLPIVIEGSSLKAITYHSPIASAQVKSCLLLAGLDNINPTRIYEKTLSRNHTELMLDYLGFDIKVGKDEFGFFSEVKKTDEKNLKAKTIEIVGDISSAAFFMVAAAIVPNSSVLIKNVGINPTRTGILDIFKQAQIDFKLINERTTAGEKAADILVNYTKDIKPFEIKGEIIPRLIDEIPVLAVLMTQAKGVSLVKDAKDLRNKESDRIKTIVEAFLALGIDIEEFEDGFKVKGKPEINQAANLKTHLDHRLAMSYYVLSLINKQAIEIEGFNCVNTSFPEFLDLIEKLKNEK